MVVVGLDGSDPRPMSMAWQTQRAPAEPTPATRQNRNSLYGWWWRSSPAVTGSLFRNRRSPAQRWRGFSVGVSPINFAYGFIAKGRRLKPTPRNTQSNGELKSYSMGEPRNRCASAHCFLILDCESGTNDRLHRRRDSAYRLLRLDRLYCASVATGKALPTKPTPP